MIPENRRLERLNWTYQNYIKRSIRESETLDDCYIALYLTREQVADWGVEIYYACLDAYNRKSIEELRSTYA